MWRRLVAAMAVLALAGCAGTATRAPVPTPGVSVLSSVLLTMPDVVGQNASVALDRLTKLGFTNVELGTVDGRLMVILPQNWTVKTQSAKPGTRLAPGDKIVLGCARNR
jgi:beta-lactam-binding protein with PASTA domain